MPYEVCYRALLSISVVEGLKPHTSLTRSRRSAARRRAAAIYNPLPRPALAGLDHNVSVFRFHPQDSLAGGPPARWFVIFFFRERRCHQSQVADGTELGGAHADAVKGVMADGGSAATLGALRPAR